MGQIRNIRSEVFRLGPLGADQVMLNAISGCHRSALALICRTAQQQPEMAISHQPSAIKATSITPKAQAPRPKTLHGA